MRRRQLFEFEDLTWVPAWCRDPITSWLQDIIVTERLYDPALPALTKVLDASGTTAITDVCSGGGGPWPDLKARLEDGVGPVSLTFTDLHPNRSGLEGAVAAIGDGRTRYRADPIDATRLPDDVEGVVTMFSAVHHLRPATLRAVLADAGRRRLPIAVFDMVDRNGTRDVVRHIPTSAFRYLHQLRPRTWRQIVATYVLPVLPAMITWDAFASNMRAYEPVDLLAISATVELDGWEWDSGTLTDDRGHAVTYLTGVPLG